MRKFTIVGLVLMLLSIALKAEKIEKVYNFETPQLERIGDYVLINFENTMNTGPAGEPALPYFPVKLLLPPGHSVASWKIIREEPVLLGENLKIYPEQFVRPISKSGPEKFYVNQSVYQSSEAYPAEALGATTSEVFKGHGIGMTSFSPVSYIPETGSVTYFRKVKLVLETEMDAKSGQILANLKHTDAVKEKLAGMIQNPGRINDYQETKTKNSDYQLLIITPAQFENDLNQVPDFYISRGIKTSIVTREYINANGNGQDLQEKIRNYIIDQYQNNSIEYVLLTGDVEQIPYRGFYCSVQSSSTYTDDDIPADLYYSALDGSWNDNGNNLWGEIGEDDLLPEVAVARFPVSDLAELNNMLNKTMNYQDNPVTGELRDPVLAGEHLWSSPETWGADYLDLLIGYQDENGYTTTGIPTDHNMDYLYERDGNWGGNDLRNSINQGRSFVHHSGHANETSVMKFWISDITNSNFSQANGSQHNFTQVFSHGCLCGSFDYNDCIMEKMVTIQNFASSVIGNSRYGWFNEGQTEGPAAHLHREFVDALYFEKLNRIGDAFVEMKIQTAPWVTAPGQWEEGALRWNFYCINILGDPAMSIWSDEPVSIDVNYSNTIPIGVPNTTVTVTTGGSPLSGMNCVIIKDDIIHGVGVTDNSGMADIVFDPVFTQVGPAQLFVSGYNCLPQEYAVEIIPNSGAYVIYNDLTINDNQGNGNNIPEFDETVKLSITVENVGVQQADNVDVTISANDPYISITDDNEGYGSIAGGNVATVQDGFEIQIANNVPDEHTVQFELEAVSDDTWNSSFSMTFYAPELTIGELSIDDSAGNNDGKLDPGEQASIIIESSNTGHCGCPGTTGELISTSPYLTITTATCNLGMLAEGETKTAVFDVIVDPQTPVGTNVDLSFTLTSGQYINSEVFYRTIGLILEDFETGDFLTFEWNFEGEAPWEITTNTVYEGDYAAKSGSIGDAQSSELKITMEVLQDGDISFFMKVSSEENYDYLQFFIDNSMMEEWSGEEDWQEVTYPVTAGQHTFRWVYEKDWSVSNGSDCGWIDYIVFPPVATPAGPLTANAIASPEELCTGESSQLYALASGGTGNFTYQWSPEAGLSDPTIYNPTASPSQTTLYEVTVDDGDNQVVADVTVTVNPVPESPIITQMDDHLMSSAVDGNQWYDTDGPVEGATNQTFYPTHTDYYHTVVTNQFGCVSAPSNVIHFVFTGLEALNGFGNLSIRPNPADGPVKIVYSVDAEEKINITILDQFGRMVAHVLESRKEMPGQYSIQVDLSHLSNGIYFCQFKSPSVYEIKKIIIQ